ncbi:MAG: ACT domain-containing protein [Oscillospiraceae bacterium]|nr:ACT domain-containing protein [Oscillospiraceae bacterium]
MKAIITVVGADRVGIIAGICALLAENKINILDINQTVMEQFFTMSMLVSVPENAKLDEISLALTKKGEEMHLSIRIQREDIFQAMHQI